MNKIHRLIRWWRLRGTETLVQVYPGDDWVDGPLIRENGRVWRPSWATVHRMSDFPPPPPDE